MDIERLFKIVISDYTNERLKLDEALESAINSNENVFTKTKMIKKIMKKIAINELSMVKFTNMIPNNNTQN